MKERPRKGASWGRPCSWHRGVGFVVNVERRVSGEDGCVRAVRRDWTGLIRVARGTILTWVEGIIG